MENNNMADVATLLAEFQKGIEGKDTGLGATVKFDFEGSGCIFLDGKSGEVDGTSAFMQGKLKVSGDMSIAMKLQSVMDALGS